MWTAELKSKSENTDDIVLSVKFTDGTKVIEREFRYNKYIGVVNFRRDVELALSNLNTQEPLLGPIVVTSSVKTQEEMDKEAWLKKYNKLQRVNQLVKDGVLTGNEQVVVEFINEVRAGFKLSYFN